MATVSKQAQEAAELIGKEFMTIGDMQKELGIGRYQYARQLIKDNRYGLGEATIEIGGHKDKDGKWVTGRVFVSRAAVQQAVKIRAERAKADAAKAKANAA